MARSKSDEQNTADALAELAEGIPERKDVAGHDIVHIQDQWQNTAQLIPLKAQINEYLNSGYKLEFISDHVQDLNSVLTHNMLYILVK